MKQNGRKASEGNFDGTSTGSNSNVHSAETRYSDRATYLKSSPHLDTLMPLLELALDTHDRCSNRRFVYASHAQAPHRSRWQWMHVLCYWHRLLIVYVRWYGVLPTVSTQGL